MLFIRLNKTERRRLTMFVTCLAIAVLAWLFFALSNLYVYELRSVLNYRNAPLNKAIHPLQGDTVTLQVQGTGWDLLFSKMKFSPEAVDVDLTELSQHNFVVFEKQLRDVNSRFPSNQKIVSVNPDTLYFDFSSRVVKKVPVNLIYKIKFAPQYKISGDIEINPSYVTVSGPAEELRNIDNWDTDSLKATEVNGPVVTQVQLVPNQKNNISFYPKRVEVRIPVAEFTEKTVEVPLRVLNRGRGVDVDLFPAKVKVTIAAGLENYPQITEKSFEASVDLDQWRSKGYKQLPVVISKSPSYTDIKKIEPHTVDFIVRK